MRSACKLQSFAVCGQPLLGADDSGAEGPQTVPDFRLALRISDPSKEVEGLLEEFGRTCVLTRCIPCASKPVEGVGPPVPISEFLKQG